MKLQNREERVDIGKKDKSLKNKSRELVLGRHKKLMSMCRAKEAVKKNQNNQIKV